MKGNISCILEFSDHQMEMVGEAGQGHQALKNNRLLPAPFLIKPSLENAHVKEAEYVLTQLVSKLEGGLLPYGLGNSMNFFEYFSPCFSLGNSQAKLCLDLGHT
jgi:hypothetical protein